MVMANEATELGLTDGAYTNGQPSTADAADYLEMLEGLGRDTTSSAFLETPQLRSTESE